MWRKTYWNAYTLWHVRDEARLPFRPFDEITARQRRRVKGIVAHAYADRALLSRGDGRGGPRSARLSDRGRSCEVADPHGAQLARDPARFLSGRYANARSLTLQSSGTSGFSKPISYDAAALFLALAHGHRQRHVLARFVGRLYGYREMRLARDGSAAFQIRAFYESHSWVPKTVDLERSSASPGERFEETIARWNAVKPDVVHGYGSHVGALVRHALQRGLPLHPPKCVTYGADPLADADRALIEAELGVPVVSTYQAAEALRIGFQCEERRAFHLSVDHTAVRVVDREGHPVAPGYRGEIVISNLTESRERRVELPAGRHRHARRAAVRVRTDARRRSRGSMAAPTTSSFSRTGAGCTRWSRSLRCFGFAASSRCSWSRRTRTGVFCESCARPGNSGRRWSVTWALRGARRWATRSRYTSSEPTRSRRKRAAKSRP